MSQNETFESTWQAVALLAPTLAVVGVFLYYPSLQTFRLSLYETFLFGGTEFIGLGHYTSLLTSPEYHHSVTVTVVYALLLVVGTLGAGFAVSFLLYAVPRGTSFYMVAAIWPYAMPAAVAGTVFLFLANPSAGLFTHWLYELTGIEFNWAVNGFQALVVVAVATIWSSLGFNIIFMLSALNNVPETIIESADIDGVPVWRRILYIYIPLISPTLVFLLVLNTTGAFFGSFAFIDLMTEGGPQGATDVLIYRLYEDAFANDRLGSASAQSVILFVAVAALTFVQLRVSDRYAYYGG